MKKIMVGIFIAIFSALVLFITWINLVPEDNVSTEKTTEEVTTEGNAKEYIAIAQNRWNGSTLDEDNIEKETTFIALNSIDISEMKDLGVATEFSELQEVAGIISGDFGRLTDEEKQIHYKEFEDILNKIHNTIN
ncbi:hypothetical protein [Planococcus maritimus]|uniref:hypothetical protein n=1 Tax=Planococcus maritimus TaxID=192421 RepID=UPI00079B89C3|nr:hypothetical protein [Planococcus maritimus]KYG58670.1 hypothetical protein AY633_00040 [Planococcus maritimus]